MTCDCAGAIGFVSGDLSAWRKERSDNDESYRKQADKDVIKAVFCPLEELSVSTRRRFRAGIIRS